MAAKTFAEEYYDTPLGPVAYGLLYTLALSVRDGLDRVFEMERWATPDEGNAMMVQHVDRVYRPQEALSTIATIVAALIDAANLDKLVNSARDT